LKHQPGRPFARPAPGGFCGEALEFFPLFPGRGIRLGMALVWGRLAPPMTVRQVAGRGRRGLAPQPDIRRPFDLAHHQNAACRNRPAVFARVNRAFARSSTSCPLAAIPTAHPLAIRRACYGTFKLEMEYTRADTVNFCCGILAANIAMRRH